MRIFLPDEAGDAPVVIVTELNTNAGKSVTNAALRIAAEIIAAHGLEDPKPVFVEHYEDGMRGTPGDPQTFDLVTFYSYAPRQTTDIDGWCWTIGPPKRKAPDRETVEALVGQGVR